MIDFSSNQCEELTSELSRATRGEAFVLMGGDCAESFSEFKVSQETAPCSKNVILWNTPLGVVMTRFLSSCYPVHQKWSWNRSCTLFIMSVRLCSF